mgnify:CR=1 FL=1
MGVVYTSKNVQRCTHCGEQCNIGAKFCKNCTRADDRRTLCTYNKELFTEKGITYHCKMCKISSDE